MKLKRFAAGITAAVMAFTVVGTPLGDILPEVKANVATVAGAETYGDFEYDILDDGTVEITDYSGSAENIDIPAEIDGKSVTGIGNSAFENCTSLTSITIPHSVTSIGNDAFSGCASLTSIEIPDSVTEMGNDAFFGCSSLMTIVVAEGNTIYSSLNGVLFNKVKTELICYPADKADKSYSIPNSVTSIGGDAFRDCASLIEVTIPNSVTSIGDAAFSGCKNLKNLKMSDSLIDIGNYAFDCCASLVDITIPSSTINIGERAFGFCTNLNSITIPCSVISIENNAFYGCFNLLKVDVDYGNNNYVSIDGVLFNKDKTKIVYYPPGKTDSSYTIPSSVTSIGEKAFSYCISLMNIEIPYGVINISDSAFSNCTNLKDLTIPNSVVNIGKSSFEQCSNLNSILISEHLKNIDDYAFFACERLKSITIPDSVTSIGDSAFYWCTNLRNATILNHSYISIGSDVFESVSDEFSISGYSNTGVERYAKNNGISFISLGEYNRLPSIPTKTTYQIKVVNDFGKTIEDFTISDNSMSIKSTGGYASISFPSAERIWKVSADKYVDKYISANELTADVNTIIMYPVGNAQKYHADKVYYSEKSDIDTVYTNGKINNYVSNFQAAEVLTGTKTIDLVRKEYGVTKNYDFYLYCASDSNENATYEVYDGKKLLATSNSKKIKLNTSMISESSSLLIVEKFADGSRNNYGVNLKAIDNKVSENSFELSTGSISLTPSDDLSWLGSWNIDMPSFPVYAKCTGDEIRIGVGISKDVLDSDSKFFDYKNSFDKLKDSRKNASPLLKAKSLAELKSKYIKSNGKTKLPGLKDGFDLTIVGCGYAKIQPGQDTYTLGVNVIVTADYSVTLSHQFFVGVVPVTVKIKAGASVEGNFDMSWVKGGSSGFANNTVLELTIEPYFKPYAGIGVDKVANVGVYGSLAMPIKITLMSPDKNAKGVNSVDIKGEAGLRANVLWLTYNYTIFKGSRNLYTKPQSTMTATIDSRIDVLNSIAYAAQSQQEPIEEILDIDNYNIVKESASAEFTNSNNGLIAGNMSQFSTSDILTSGDMTILATVNTDESRGINNQSYIVTSVYRDGEWSAPERINDSVYSELAPKLYKSGDDIFLIYQQATKEFTDDAANSEITDNIGIAVSKFNPDTMKFENTNMIYSKEGYSFAPKTDGNLAVWVNNEDGNPFGNTDNNSIVIYDGENVTEVKPKIGNVLSADVGKLSDNSYIAYTVDKDGDLTTTDDIQLYITSSDGSKTNLVAEGDIDSIAFSDKKYGMLLWSNGGKLSYLNSENTDSVISTDKVVGNCFGVLDDNTIYYFDSVNQSESGLYVMNYNGTAWTMPYLYSTTDGNVVYAGSDGYDVFYSTCDDETYSGQRKLYSVQIKTVNDIQVNYIDFDPAYLVNSSQIPIDVSLTNNGSETVQTVAFRISDEQMNTINTYTLDNLNIEPGETSECTLLIQPDDNCIGKKIYVTVAEPSDPSVLTDEALDADLESDRTPENNRYSLDFTKSDLEVKTEEYKFGENHSLIFTVLNNTDVVTGGTLKVFDSTGKEILSRHFDDISFNESKIAELDESELVPEGKFSEEITATVISDNDEYYDYNNTATQWISLMFDEKFNDFSATDINKNGLTLKWNGITENCGVAIEQLVGDEWEEIATLNDGSVGKYMVSGLTELTKYEFRIRAFKNYGSETGYGDYETLEVSTCHVFGEWVTVTESTCTEDGEESRTCEVCGETETRRTTATGHDYSDQWTVDVEAACNDGSKSHHCTRCDAKTDITVIPGKGHKVVIDAAVAPSCTEPGLTEGKHCSVCNTVIKAQETVPATGKHSFGDWKITKAATCTAEGTQTRTCSGCGKVETQTIAKTAHKYVNTVVKPTYTAKGYTLHKCSVCGTSYKDTYTAKLTLAKVTGVKLGGRAADALRVNWTKNANASGYIVEMYQGNKWVRVAKITNNSTTTFRKAGLKAGTAYKFRVRAYKMSGKTAVYGAYSATVAARTNPSVMTGAKLSGRAADALRINWTKNTSADGYIVEMYQGNKWVRVAKITKNSTTTFRKAGLKASTVYKFRVRAYKMSGKAALYGNYSATVTARTNPSVMTGVKIAGKAKDALRVNWTKNTSAQGYIVEMYKGGKWVRVAKITNGNTTTFRKAGLAKNTAYKFRVKAYYMSGKTALYGNYGSVSGKTAAK